MDSQREAYKAEAQELLGELETSLLELEDRPGDQDLIDRVFRAMHTIKGSGAMFGFDHIAAFTHDVETVFDRVRDGELAVSGQLVNLALKARDHISTLLEADDDPSQIDNDRGDTVLTAFHQILRDCAEPTAPQHKLQCKPNSTPDVNASEKLAFTLPDDKELETEGVEDDAETIYRIRFQPNLNLFATGTNPLLLIDELEQMGQCRVVAQLDRLPDLSTFDPESCYLYWDIILTTSASRNDIQDVFIFVEDDCELVIEKVSDPMDPDQDGQGQRLGEILIEKGDLAVPQLERALDSQKKLGQLLVDADAVAPAKVTAALAEQQQIRQARTKSHQPSTSGSIRVAAEKLDKLVDLVGELVTVQARLGQRALQDKDGDLMAISEVVERLTAELRDNTLSIRMLPIGMAFNKLRRLVRDLSAELGKRVVMQTEGSETELDKTVIEQLNDPLIHIIRNSIDHGIESPDQRRAAGKPEQGTIYLTAEHSGANVLIHIVDDGAGIDIEQLRAKAVRKGLLSSEAERSDKEIQNLIFAPGFSTAASVTSVSGRGVGMDVVKRSIENLRGNIAIDSKKGRGTTITLKLPLTLAIIDGLLVGIGSDRYVLPLSAIEECVELTRRQIEDAHDRNMLNIRGQIVPYVKLRELFDIPGDAPAIQQVVINEVAGQRVGIVVDRVIGEHQIVIKTMSQLYRHIEEISGATILGDGTVALIVDVQKLIQRSEMQRQAA